MVEEIAVGLEGLGLISSPVKLDSVLETTRYAATFIRSCVAHA